MSLPNDETQEPQDNMDQADTESRTPEELSASDSDSPGPASEGGDLDADLSKAESDGDDMEVAAEGADETIDFAAPAEMESGIAFDSVDSPDEDGEPEEPGGDEFLAGLAGAAEEAGETEEFGVEKADERDEESQQEEKEKPAKRAQRILTAIGESDPYTILMGIALLALLFGILFFYLELSAYNFDIGAQRAKQLVGALDFGWLSWLP